MGHLREKYTTEYFLGGFDAPSGHGYGVLGYAEFNNNTIHERLLAEFRFLVSFAACLENKDILEIGCGRGDHIPFYIQENIRSYRGIDFSINSLSIVENYINHPKVRLELCDAKHLDISESYDVIAMFDVFEHIPVFDMEVVWRKISKILRPAGCVVFSTPIFDNPNNSDLTDYKHAVMGMHCHKQTIGTIVRTCLKYGFVIGNSTERCFGLVRNADIPLFEKACGSGFIENHRKMLENLGVPPAEEDRKFFQEELLSLVPAPGRILVGCIVENGQRDLLKALRLIQSIRWFGGSMSGVNIMVCYVDQPEDAYVEALEAWGAFVRVAPRFNYLYPDCNKLCFFSLSEIHAYDTVMLMDCGSIFVQDAAPYINGNVIQARITNIPADFMSDLENIFPSLDYSADRLQSWETMLEKQAPIGLDASVLVVPKHMITSLAYSWGKIASAMLGVECLAGKSSVWYEQISLALACCENMFPIEKLPPQMNFSIDKLSLIEPEILNGCDPVIINYNNKFDDMGLIVDTVHDLAQRRITAFNERVRTTPNVLEKLQITQEDLTEELNRRLFQISTHRSTIDDLRNEVSKRDVSIGELQREVDRLKVIEDSLSWRMVRRGLDVLDNKLLPPGTRRGELFASMVNKVRKTRPAPPVIDQLPNPVFIVGCMRSGTTLLAELLGKHQGILYSPFELRNVWSKAGGVPMASPKTGDSLCPHLTAKDVTAEQIESLSLAFQDVHSKNFADGKTRDAIFLSKNPHLCNKLAFVERLFKEPRYIWIYRNLVDVVLSLKGLFTSVYELHKTYHYWPEKEYSDEVRCWNCFHGNVLPIGVNKSRCFPGGDITYLAEYWVENNSAVGRFFSTIPLTRKFIVREEDLLVDAVHALKQCFSFLHLSPDVHAFDISHIDRDRNGRWKSALTKEERSAIGEYLDSLVLNPGSASHVIEILHSHRSLIMESTG
jgi:SAM-dependent methyltransferase